MPQGRYLPALPRADALVQLDAQRLDRRGAARSRVAVDHDAIDWAFAVAPVAQWISSRDLPRSATRSGFAPTQTGLTERNDTGRRSPVNTRAQSTWRAAALAVSLLVALTAFTAAATAGPEKKDADVRFSTFNASLNRFVAGQLRSDLIDARQRPGDDGGGDRPAGSARRAAHQRVRLRPAGRSSLFQDNYLSMPHRTALCRSTTRYRYIAPSNTGEPIAIRPQQRRLRRRAE